MLEISYNDREISSLNISDITPYLKKTGWRLVSKSPYLVFEGVNDDEGKPIQIVLPKGKDQTDIQLRIAETINLLSAIENRSPYEVIRAIKGINKDIVFFIPKTYKISLEKAKSYINKIKQYYNYSASVEAEPCKSFVKSNKKGKEFVEKNCFFGHTFNGSFGFTIETELLPRSQSALDGREMPPFERRVVERLVRGIKFAHESEMEGSPDILIKNYESGLNSNMCDVLSDIIEEFKDIDTEFGVSWSPSYEPEESLKNINIRLNSNAQKYLKSASKSLCGAAESQKVTLWGKIIELKRPFSEDYEEEGDEILVEENHIILRDEDSEKNVHITLKESDYKLACDAHKDKKMVSIQGTLEKEIMFWVLRNPYNFRTNLVDEKHYSPSSVDRID
jgi:hypothetical protein